MITRGVQEHGIKILFPLHTNGFGALQDDDKTEEETAGEEMLCAIPYFENSNKSIFYDLKKRAKNNYVMNKAEFLSTVAAVQNLLLNFQHNYNSYMQSQFNDISNKLNLVRKL